MQTSLYQPYPIGDLKELLGGKPAGMRPASTTSSDDVRARQQALDTLFVYEYKDRNGKPLPYELSEAERARLTDIQLTQKEASLLGVKGNKIPLQDLLWLTKAENTPRPAFVTDEMMRLAAYLATRGVRQDERLSDAMRALNAAYVNALNALAILSRPIKTAAATDRKANVGAQKIIRMLAGIEIAQTSIFSILLTEKEYQALHTGKISDDFEFVLCPTNKE